MGRNWDQHYAAAANVEFAPEPLLVQVADLVPAGKALDLACGCGRNALYLAGLVVREQQVPRLAGHLLGLGQPDRRVAARGEERLGRICARKYSAWVRWVPGHTHRFPASRPRWSDISTPASMVNVPGLPSGSPGAPSRWCMRAGAGERRDVQRHLHLPGTSSVPGPVSDSASPKAGLPVSSAARAGAWAAAGK